MYSQRLKLQALSSDCTIASENDKHSLHNEYQKKKQKREADVITVGAFGDVVTLAHETTMFSASVLDEAVDVSLMADQLSDGNFHGKKHVRQFSKLRQKSTSDDIQRSTNHEWGM